MGITQHAHARLHRVRRRAAAVAGLALVTSMAPLIPAQAGLLDPISPITDPVTDPVTEVLDPVTDPVTGTLVDPVVDTTTGVVTDPDTGTVLGLLDPTTGELLLAPLPAIGSGSGTLETLVGGAFVPLCSSADQTCGQVPIQDLVDEAAIVLRAVPEDPAATPTWDPASCPTVIGDICMVTVEDLAGGTALEPVASFLPAGGGDLVAPDTLITSAAPQWLSREHTFTFAADPTTATTRFECRLEVAYAGAAAPADAVAAHDWQPCTGPSGSQTYPNLANGTYVFAVAAVDGPDVAPATDATPATQSWNVAAPPETRVQSGPRHRSFLLTRRAAFTFRSTVEPSSFQCWYDGHIRACDAGRFVWRQRTDGAPLRPGRHIFRVAATAGGTQDPTPEVRTFHVPIDDRALRAVKTWRHRKQPGHFHNTVATTRLKGAALVTRKPQRFRRVVLVADKGRGHGTVKVFKGRRLLKEVSLDANQTLLKRRVIRIKRFRGKLRSGRIRVVVTSAGKPVRIDAIGVARR